ncbi:hypothetical protein [Burkholderia sp.]|uniref:hypothetical protein n=1 Tax=Burkholderia sp. TaxID=36773 RepID=UPI0025BBD82A|nr:hypothetical protein [Burkholderia sp.]MBS6359848.1 hypothetical protein [Burkholderia sp.]
MRFDDSIKATWRAMCIDLARSRTPRRMLKNPDGRRIAACVARLADRGAQAGAGLILISQNDRRKRHLRTG